MECTHIHKARHIKARSLDIFVAHLPLLLPDFLSAYFPALLSRLHLWWLHAPFGSFPCYALLRREIKTFIRHLLLPRPSTLYHTHTHTHTHVYSYVTVQSSVLSICPLLCMVQLLSHGAAGTWLLTDTDTTARQTQEAPHLGVELKMFRTRFEVWYSNRSSYGNSDLTITTLPCYVEIQSAYDFVHHNRNLNIWEYIICIMSSSVCDALLQKSSLNSSSPCFFFLSFRRYQPWTGWAFPKWRNKCCATPAENKSTPGFVAGLPTSALHFIAPPSVQEGIYT